MSVAHVAPEKGKAGARGKGSKAKAKPRKERPRLEALGSRGILFADLSGYTQLMYQCAPVKERMDRMSIALYRLFERASSDAPDVMIEGYLGDGILALGGGATPVYSVYRFARTLRERFEGETRSLLMNLGVRTSVSLRVGLHAGDVWRFDLASGGGAKTGAVIADAVNLASRIVVSQTCRRHGLALSRDAYRRLLRLGKKSIREPDEVIQDLNKYPEPIDVYRLLPEEERSLS